MSESAPRLRPRPSESHQLPNPSTHHPLESNDEPPPAYTPSATTDTQLLDSGPRYPFGPTSNSLPTHPSQYQSQPPHQSQQSHQSQQPQWTASPHHPHLNQPWSSQPQNHWPQQLHHSPPHPTGPTSGYGYHPSPSSAGPSSHSSHQAPWNGRLDPTKVPTSGHPLLWDDRVLVYPSSGAVFCSKCCNTGYKGFDPSRPCRKCWDKYGKLWSVVKLSPPSDNLNLQRPLPPVSGQPAPALIVRPGDPRIGGRLCWNCSGSGEVTDEGLFGILFTSTDRCRVCQGAGRTF